MHKAVVLGHILVYTELSSFQDVGIEEFQRCPHFQGVGIEEFHCIQRCPHFRVLK